MTSQPEWITMKCENKPEECKREEGFLQEKEWISPKDAYIYVGQQKLRRGYTTGSCAAAAAQAAARLLFGEKNIDSVSLTVPKGLSVCIPIVSAEVGNGWAQASVKKDSGDDPDVTNGIEVFVRIEAVSSPGITIFGGEGVGKVTKPGLEMPVGESAINKTPRSMIRQQIESVRQHYPEWEGVGFRVTITIPAGVEIAKKTYNPRLGIEGGISVLGTSGIVEPMSEKALTDSIQLELNILKESGHRCVLITPGNYGKTFLSEGSFSKLAPLAPYAVKCSNFVGDTLDFCVQAGYEQALLVGHIGKFSKLAAGVMNTHSHYADARLEVFAAHAALCGATQETIVSIMSSVTTDEAIACLEKEGIRQAVMQSILKKIEQHISARAGETLKVGVILFSNVYGYLGQTKGCELLIEDLLKEYCSEDKKE